MKYLIILADGAADYPIESLGGLTPLQAAKTPNIDNLCAKSCLGLLETVPADMPPGSEVANLSVMGYDVKEVYQGRGVLEAASMGIDIKEDELAMRCNLICIEEGKIKNHSAGHISTEESHKLIESINERFKDEEFTFHPGVSYRHLFVLPGGSDQIKCTPPHDVPGTLFEEVMVESKIPSGNETTTKLNYIIRESQKVLSAHPINKKRVSEGKDPANSVWFWSQGYRPKMQTFAELYNKTGAVISAVDLIFGIGVYAGLKPIHVTGATGLYDTNYEGKAQAAIEALKENDFVFLHIEASDEAGHEGNAELKTRTIEYLDSRTVAPIVEALKGLDESVALAILPDHPTPCALKTHVHDAVPVMIYNPKFKGDGICSYDEQSVQKGSLGRMVGTEFIRTFFKV